MFFEHLLARSAAESGLRIHAYALMSNHFHLVVNNSECDLSAVMRDAQRRHARWFNERTSQRGPLFEPRFVAVPIRSSEQFHAATRYVHRNPVDIVGARGLAAYRWSSLPVYLGRRRAPAWLSLSPLADEIQQDSYLERVVESGESGPTAIVLRSVTPDELVEAVHEVVGAVAECRIDARHLVALVAREVRTVDVTVLARRFAVSPVTVRRWARNAATRCQDDETLDNLRRAAIASIHELAQSGGE